MGTTKLGWGPGGHLEAVSPKILGELPPNAPHGLAASTSAAIHIGELKVE